MRPEETSKGGILLRRPEEGCRHCATACTVDLTCLHTIWGLSPKDGFWPIAAGELAAANREHTPPVDVSDRPRAATR